MIRRLTIFKGGKEDALPRWIEALCRSTPDEEEFRLGIVRRPDHLPGSIGEVVAQMQEEGYRFADIGSLVMLAYKHPELWDVASQGLEYLSVSAPGTVSKEKGEVPKIFVSDPKVFRADQAPGFRPTLNLTVSYLGLDNQAQRIESGTEDYFLIDLDRISG